MNESRQSLPLLWGEVVDHSNDIGIAYADNPRSSGSKDLLFVFADAVANAFANIVVQQVWSAPTRRRFLAAAPVEVFALGLVETEPRITLWETWKRREYSSSAEWFDESTDAVSSSEACVEHVNQAITLCLYSRMGYAAPNVPLALPTPNWVHKAIELSRKGKQDESLDVIFDNIDEMLLRGEFDKCDCLLTTMPVSQLSNVQLITVLTATLPAKEDLPNRGNFFRQVRAALQARDSDTDLLLLGLE